MNELKKKLLKQIIGIPDGNLEDLQQELIHNFNHIEIAFEEYKEDFKNEPIILNLICKCYAEISQMYYHLITNYIEEFASTMYGYSMDFVLTNYDQEDIVFKMEEYLNRKFVSQTFKNDVYNEIRKQAILLNKRFSFDEVVLIHLIEASSGNNIILEAQRKNKNQVLSESNGIYTLKESPNTQVYTHDGTSISNSKDQSEEKRDIKNFPLGKLLVNTDNAMQKVMNLLFDNLNLCIETYNSIYKSGNNAVLNTALLSDGSIFNFEYIINDRNIPHLLGFPRGNKLSKKARDYLNILIKSNNRPRKSDGSLIILTNNSNALDVLRVIYENQRSIIASCGLYTDNDKKYEIINWEKVILKTTSFMKSDFFKTCFCLVKLSLDKYLVDPSEKGGYISISSTEYNEGLNIKNNAKTVLHDLLNARKQKRDYIFRGFITKNGVNIPNSIMTGKAETIYVEKENELLKTLQRYRELFEPENTGYVLNQNKIVLNERKKELISPIVKEIENEKFIKKFTPKEQAELGISIASSLLAIPYLSQEALDFIRNVYRYSQTELEKFKSAITQKDSIEHTVTFKRH